MEIPVQSPVKESVTQSSPEKIAGLKNYIYRGGQLIKQGKYDQAIKHFDNKAELHKVDWCLLSARVVILKKIPKPEEYTRLANEVARFSKNMNRTLELSTICVMGEPNTSFQPQILPQELQHEISLVHMEEWLHCLQDVQGRPLAGQNNEEIDVAVYMKRNNIPMTKAFLQRYGRAETLNKLNKQEAYFAVS